MSDFRVLSRSALVATQPRTFGGLKITAIEEGSIVQVLAKSATPELANLLSTITGGTPHAVRAAGPTQWYLVGDKPLSHGDLTRMLETLAPLAAGVDQSHGRVRIRIEGPMVERLLAKGTAVDVDIAAFPVGQSAATLFGHVGCHLTRLDTNVFELMVLRGFAESLWDDLVQSSVEYA